MWVAAFAPTTYGVVHSAALFPHLRGPSPGSQVAARESPATPPRRPRPGPRRTVPPSGG